MLPYPRSVLVALKLSRYSASSAGTIAPPRSFEQFRAPGAQLRGEVVDIRALEGNPGLGELELIPALAPFVERAAHRSLPFVQFPEFASNCRQPFGCRLPQRPLAAVTRVEQPSLAGAGEFS